MIIKIKNLRLRTIIGFKTWEREKKQDITVNLEIGPLTEKSTKSDSIKDSVDYKKIKYRLVDEVEKSEFFLIERLAGFILDLIFEDKNVGLASVEIDKPHALRFAESVSVKLTRKRKNE
jgi:D-erythro-7,8-dihydroneopterin triphosphate epimerase